MIVESSKNSWRRAFSCATTSANSKIIAFLFSAYLTQSLCPHIHGKTRDEYKLKHKARRRKKNAQLTVAEKVYNIELMDVARSTACWSEK